MPENPMPTADNLPRFLTVVGARPQFVKAAALSQAVGRRDDIREIIVHTGQHFDANMSQVFFDQMNIPQPDYRLDLHGGGHGRGHGAMTGRMLEALEDVLEDARPDMVLVYGDTNSTLAGALAGAKRNIPVAHVESGLRSFDRTMPEEINRVVADHVATLLFCPTATAVRNLAAEGITAGVHEVGDVTFDATLMMIDAARRTSTIVTDLGLDQRPYAVATLHRAATTDSPEALARAIGFLGERAAEHAVILPLHPRTRAAVEREGIGFGAVTVIDPLGPLDMQRLLIDCVAVYTDSGGLQKEAYFHRKPCVTLRDATEWVETVEAGWNRLWTGPDYAPRRDISDYGLGDSADRTLQIMVDFLRLRQPAPSRL
jgi:UDP-GlcNAc3NAcA epimerase